MVVANPNVEVLINSPGGVGTTFLAEFISKYRTVNCPHDQDGCKHTGLPLLSRNPKIKRIFIFGDIKLAVLSLFRRQYHYQQSYKIQIMLRYRPDPIPESVGLIEYLTAGVDKFLFEEQFCNYYERYLHSETLFLRYEAIHKHKKELIEFLNLPKSAVDAFPLKRERISDIMEVDKEILDLLELLYGDFNRYLDTLPDFQVKKPHKANTVNSALLKHPKYAMHCLRKKVANNIEILRKRF